GQGGALKGKGAQAVDVVILGELRPVAEGAAGPHHRIGQGEPAEAYLGIYHSNSSPLNTGPSAHTRLGPEAVSMVQPMQAPTPQAMRPSRLYQPWGYSRLTARSMGSGPQAYT